MFPAIINILTSLLTLYTTTFTSILISRLIIFHVKTHGPIPIFQHIIKLNSIFYSLFSLFLFLAILTIFSTTPSTFESIICQPNSSIKYFDTFDGVLRLIFHASKIYEYVDIFNVLAVGGKVNTHFWVHHFTVCFLFPSSFLIFNPEHTKGLIENRPLTSRIVE